MPSIARPVLAGRAGSGHLGCVQAVHPLVSRVLAPNPSPFTGTGTQVHLVGTGELAVIDPGPDDPAHLQALRDAIGGRPVRAIVITHHHRDHSPASRPLQRLTGAPIVGAAPVARGAAGGFDADYRPDRVLADGEALAGPDWTLETIATPGHTSNHLCFALPEAEAVFTGDHVMGWSTTVVIPPDGDMGAYLASLERLARREGDRIFYPAHGDPIDNPARALRGQIGHRRQREAQVRRLLEEGVSDVPGLVARMYPGLDPRLAGGAGATVLAHLLDLQRRELATCESERWAA